MIYYERMISSSRQRIKRL